MSVSNPNKEINKTKLKCGESAKVTLSFESDAELIKKPSDIIIMIDKSDSMTGEKFAFAKKGIISLVNYIVQASGGVKGKVIGNNTRIGLLSFGFHAVEEAPLTNNAELIYSKINDIEVILNKTNHFEAFTLARNMIDFNSPNDKVIVAFTDGETTFGENPYGIIKKLKEDGVEIFCVGLTRKSSTLKLWASPPIENHVVTTNDAEKLENLFIQIAYEIIKAGAKDIIITEKVNPNFNITNFDLPTHGSIELINNQTFKWNIEGAGVKEKDNIKCSFDVKYIGEITGKINVNEEITYKDRDNNELIFPNPMVEVICEKPLVIEENIKNINSFQIEACKDAKVINLSESNIEDIGRIIQVDVILKNVCPNKKVNLSVILTEIDFNGIEHSRGNKIMVIPEQISDVCKDVLVKCINFVVPESLDTTGNVKSMCNDRNFKIRVIANYADTDYISCDPQTVIINDKNI